MLLFPSVCLLDFFCQILDNYNYVYSSLVILVCSTDVHFCFYAKTILFYHYAPIINLEIWSGYPFSIPPFAQCHIVYLGLFMNSHEIGDFFFFRFLWSMFSRFCWGCIECVNYFLWNGPFYTLSFHFHSLVLFFYFYIFFTDIKFLL